MGSSLPSEVVYEGEVLIANFDAENLAELEERLQDFIDLEDGEELYVSMTGGERIEVRKLRETEE